MARLYVPLDVDYFHDPKMIDVNPLAELLYVRGLCFAKRNRKDGLITRGQLKVIAVGIPKPASYAADLVAVGAWLEAPEGWVIAGWLKWNKSVADLEADAEARRLKSLMANHRRWHVDRDEFDPTCELCKPPIRPYKDPTGDPPQDPQIIPSERKGSEGITKRRDNEAKGSEGKSPSHPTDEFKSISTAVGELLDGKGRR